MPLIKLTRTIPAGAAVYINTDNIAAITPFSTFTHVLINAAGEDGNLALIAVTELPHVVAHIFENATHQ
ncbi:hypothetical protein J3U99_20675 [Brucella pituitosa]|uniref:hypothetical protein n=1 Tax=Brucella pituitosa TaxID=571256 RepID=UPI002005F9F3|nr:hypothetical protein [Brucella pituitosa]MCK4207186.1 hypothetical protein [Brucella pituitosa]